MNSIAAYCMAEYLLCGGDSPEPGWIAKNLNIHFGQNAVPDVSARNTSRSSSALAIMFVIWLILYYMYRHKIFLKI